MHHPILAVSLAALACTAGAVAQSIVVPAAYASARGTGGSNTLTRDMGEPRTFMQGFDASELAALPPGAVLTGMSFRAGVGSTPPSWPPTQAIWTDYEVTLGAAAPLASWTGTFASNFAGTPVLVRSGPMVIEPGTFTNVTSLPSPQPNAWGEFYRDFQRGFVYPGGDLAIQVAHTGSNLTASFAYLDYQTVVTTIKAYTATSFRAATGTPIASPTIVRLHYGYGVACPGQSGSPMLVQNENLATAAGGTLRMSVGNGTPNAAALYVFGFGRQQIPLGNGCDLLTVPIGTRFVVLDALGSAQVQIVAPPGVLGGFEAQALVLDPTAPGGFVATNGIEPRAL